MRCLIILFFVSLQCNAQSVKELIDSSGIVYPKVALAIYKHESNHGRSKLAKNNNNLYGFKSGKYYKKYHSKTESIEDYKRFESRIIEKHDINSWSQYLRVIGRIYASDKQWLMKIKKML